ncbi:hypothetical protein [Streptomyces sp. YGL11-2]|uniref:hypothetical protein n=1 Tax=Streptomyces sp. YGL11-2 TaxID=3414028 RepID=UPI003CF60FE4
MPSELDSRHPNRYRFPQNFAGKKDFKLTIPNQDITPQKETALKKQLNTGLKAAGCPTA